MPESFEVQSSAGPYRVEIRTGLFADILKQRDADAVIVCDSRFAPQVRQSGLKYLALEAVETSKSLDAMTDVVVKLRELGLNRQSHLMVVGGGIIQDIGAFVAAIYMRGVTWSYAPTTLLGMADSCIGGKSSINVGKYKNLVGTIVPPKAVLIDPAFIGELPPLQRAAGLCEAAKICFVRGPEAFDSYCADHPAVGMDVAGHERIIRKSLLAKKWFVEIDEFDRRERQLLNFGHTFGHALEGAYNFSISHGIAVGLGIMCVIDLGQRLGRDYRGLPRVARLNQHMQDLVANANNLGEVFDSITPADACRYFVADKKHGSNHYSAIVITQQGTVERIALPKDRNTLAMCEQSFESVFAKYTA